MSSRHRKREQGDHGRREPGPGGERQTAHRHALAAHAEGGRQEIECTQDRAGAEECDARDPKRHPGALAGPGDRAEGRKRRPTTTSKKASASSKTLQAISAIVPQNE